MSFLLLWPGASAETAPVWRLLHFSGLVPTERDAAIALKAGIVYLNGNLVTSSKLAVPMDREYTLTLDDGAHSKSKTFRLANKPPPRAPRPATERTLFRKP